MTGSAPSSARLHEVTAVPWWAGRPRPVVAAAALVGAPVLVTVGIGLVGAAAGDGSDASQLRWRLLAVLVVAAAALLVVARAHAWERTGAAGPASWRRPGLLAVPALVALAPLVTGVDLPGTGTLAVLLAGYVATGVFEEIWHRGVVLDTLRSLGLRRSAVIGGALFAVSHLANIAFGQSPAVSLAQAVGAFCFGVGFSVLRWRTHAIWLLAGVHAVGDLMFKITNLHGGALWGFLVGHDIAMLAWGLWCLRGAADEVSA
ncbi:lysostaphin resistance A-like protein [Actinotalea sp.]|uniref:CPBP family intramembrane glutamic endopeptidase n=1 Tax=Actinotalea sp. TaxID=1872145 RepID=UPI00356949FD